MANEATINVGLSILKRSTNGLNYLLNPNYQHSFRSTVTGTKGPVPGSILVPLTGVDVDLSQLTTPGLCWLHHQGRSDGNDVGDDPSIYYVEYGIRDSITSVYWPLGELWPGDQFPLRLSRNLEESYNATGTGTGPPVHFLHLQSHIAACTVFVGAFEF